MAVVHAACALHALRFTLPSPRLARRSASRAVAIPPQGAKATNPVIAANKLAAICFLNRRITAVMMAAGWLRQNSASRRAPRGFRFLYFLDCSVWSPAGKAPRKMTVKLYRRAGGMVQSMVLDEQQALRQFAGGERFHPPSNMAFISFSEAIKPVNEFSLRGKTPFCLTAMVRRLVPRPG